MNPRRRLLFFALVAALSALACKKVLGLSNEPGAYESADGGTATVDPARPDSDVAIALPPNSDASCNADRLRDPKNCGSCGHDCLDGACQSGRCQPTTVLAVKDTNIVFAVRQGDVYAPEKDMIVRAGNGTTKATVVPAGIGSTPNALALQDTRLVWATYSDGLRGCTTKNCTGVTQISAANKPARGVGPLPGSTALWPLVWIGETKLQTYTASGTINSFADAGGGEAQCNGLTANDTYAFYADMAGSKIHTIKRLDGNTATIVKSSPANYPCAIRAHGNRLFWADVASIWRANIAADGSLSGATALADDTTLPGTMDVDDAYVYWANTAYDNAAILRCPIDDCKTPEVFVRLEYPALHIAIDGPYLYFSVSINSTAGTQIDRVVR